MRNTSTAAITILALATAMAAQTMPSGADPSMWSKAVKIHKKAIVIDGHNDIPSPLTDDDIDLGTDSRGKIHPTDGTPFHSDLNRFKASGITGEFFSIYVGGDTWKAGRAMPRAIDMIDATYRQVERHPQQLTSCMTADEILRAKRSG
jgi:membrane dipeptidase